MNRLILTLLTSCLAVTVMAEPIGKQAALYTAKTYMLAKGKSINTVQKPYKVRQAAGQTSGEEDNAYYYVFNAGGDGGYVIVSGDDRVEPILGYVEQGTFDPDNIPDNMRSWLQGYADEIKYVIDNDIHPDSPLLKKRNKVRGTKHSVAEILTTRWNQGLPYNLTINKYYKEDGSLARPATGCIATAWAQVINFHKFPDKIKAEIPAYSKSYTLSDGSSRTVTFPAVPRGSIIDWENMRDTYSCSESHAHTAQDTAVANLMRYCGQAVKMGYGPTSGANWKVGNIVKYFGFDDSAYRAGRDQYSIDEWFDLIYNEVAAGYPVPFSGTKISGGHAFVIDGFDGENLFHVNWGWGGGSNGWFLIGVLNSGDNSGIGAAAGSGGYARGQAAVIGLRRPDSEKADTYLTIEDVSINGTSVNASFTNDTGSKGSFNVAVVRQEEDGTYTPVGIKLSIPSMETDDKQNKSFQISGKLPEGTYKLSPASKTIKSDNWRPLYNLRDQYIEAVVDADGVPTMRIVNPVYDLNVDAIDFPGLRIAGQEQEIVVTFRNDGDEFYKDIHLFASKTQTKVYTESLARVAVRKGKTAKFSFYYTPEETGTYNLWFCTSKNGSGLIGQGTMEVITESQAVKANLAVSYTIVNGSGTTAYGKRYIGKAQIKNNGSKDFHGDIKIQLWKQKIGSSSATSGSSSMYSIDVPAGKTTSVDIVYENLSVDYYYRFKAMYVNQEGNLSGGGLWDYKCEIKDGLLTWKNDGTVAGQEFSTTLRPAANICGIYADCSKNITRVTPNKNPNTIYAFTQSMEIPSKLDTSNVVKGNNAERIKLVYDQPYFIPISFTADLATFFFTFPTTEEGKGWHAFTLPFRADSILVDSLPVLLNDPANHFWIYEFAAQGNNGEVIFAPATELRGSTPYIIAGDDTMAGQTIVFQSHEAPFFKTGSDKMIVTSSDYRFQGAILAPEVNNCYVLNNEGTAFEYVTATTTLPAQMPYFTTSLPEGKRLPSIVLPEIPQSEDPTGIKDLSGRWTMLNESTYNLAGQKVDKPQRGINIINGKKLLIK